MAPQFVMFYGIVVVLFSLIYFAFASLPFLLVPLEVPEVGSLFRGLYRAYFWMVAVAAFVATAAFAAGGRFGFMCGTLALAIAALALRERTLRRIDAYQEARQGGDPRAIVRLRVVHWGSMAGNFVVLSMVAGSIRYL